MTRILRSIPCLLLFLVAGLIINIALASALAQSARGAVWMIPRESIATPANWPSSVPPHWPPRPAKANLQRLNAGCRRLMVNASVMDHSGFHNIFGRAHVKAGWPLPALERLENWEHSEHIGDYPIGWPYDYRPVSDTWRGGLVVENYRFPLRPVPPGFVVNTLPYAALSATLWYTPGTIRRARRRYRNACPNCGYARIGLPRDTPCPECGAEEPQ